MTFSTSQSIIIAIGIFSGLVWSRRTGWSCGGIITPGLLALGLDSPMTCAASLLAGAALALPLYFLKNKFCLYGKERVGAAMLLAIFAKIFLFDNIWLGWVIPGLIAADAERQGTVMTLASAAGCALFTKFVSIILVFSGAI